MAHTFDIRFARSAGFAALLEAPSNSFHWTGSGRLSIDAQGVSVAVKRGLLSLLARNRTRRIPAADLKEVFREGEALRVEFATGKSARASLRFWANDRDVAAQIVKLLPTSRTVELEDESAATGFRINRRTLILLVVALTATACCVVVFKSGAAAPPAAAPEDASFVPSMAGNGEPAPQPPPTTGSDKLPGVGSASTELPPAVTGTPVAKFRVREVVIPVYGERLAEMPPSTETPGLTVPAMDDSDAPGSAEVLPAAENTAWEDRVPPVVFRVRVSSDGIVPFVPGMAAYEAARRQVRQFTEESERGLWWEMTVRVHTDPAFKDPALWPLRDAELAASQAVRTYDREFARMLTARVYQYVD